MSQDRSSSSEVESVREAEEHNYVASRNALGPTAELSDDHIHLYDLIPEFVGELPEGASQAEEAAHLLASTSPPRAATNLRSARSAFSEDT